MSIYLPKREEPQQSISIENPQLSSVPARPLVLEGFKPVSESLEWRIGQAYWAVRGNQAFLDNDVPHLITNDGMHAARAADVLFASCSAAARAGHLEEVVEVAEFGVGLGLHARLFLDRFRARCAETGVDFYERLTFYATDRSSKMLTDIASLGTLAHHCDHIRLGHLDAMKPTSFVELESNAQTQLHGLRAVLHNYLMDTLSFDVLLQSDGHWLRLHLRASIDRMEAARQCTDIDLTDLPALAKSGDEADLKRLLPLYELFNLDRAYIPVDIRQLPFGEHVLSFADTVRMAQLADYPEGTFDICMVHSHGALTSLISTLDLLCDDGFILFNDYGSTDLDNADYWHQRYAGSRSMGLNFALLHHALGRLSPRPVCIVAPEGDERAMIHSRLLCLEALPEVEQVFRIAFAQASFETLGKLLQQARTAHDQGDQEAAQAFYSQAHRQYPENWYVLVEWSEFATYSLSDPTLGVNLAEKAISMNLTGSSLVHTVYGDALYGAGRRKEARDAYLAALRIQPDDIRAHGSLAGVYADEGRYREAISELSLAIANDTMGAYRQTLIGKLNEILDRRDAFRNGNRTNN